MCQSTQSGQNIIQQKYLIRIPTMRPTLILYTKQIYMGPMVVHYEAYYSRASPESIAPVPVK